MMKMKRTEKNMHNNMRLYLKFKQYSKVVHVIPDYHQVVVQALTTVGL